MRHDPRQAHGIGRPQSSKTLSLAPEGRGTNVAVGRLRIDDGTAGAREPDIRRLGMRTLRLHRAAAPLVDMGASDVERLPVDLVLDPCLPAKRREGETPA